MVNGVYLNQFTGSRDARAAWVVWSDTFLPRSVEAVVTAQDAPHTAETNAYSIVNAQMMPNDLSTALQTGAQAQDVFDENRRDSCG
jgi:hypothetical protein